MQVSDCETSWTDTAASAMMESTPMTTTTIRRTRRKHVLSFDSRLQQAAADAREAARLLPEGQERTMLLTKARQAEVAAHINAWLASPNLHEPSR